MSDDRRLLSRVPLAVPTLLVAAASVLLWLASSSMLHLTHHRHTNEPDLDPDSWSSNGSRWSLPLRWLTQDLHHYAFYFRRWATRRVNERRTVVLQLVGLYGLAATLALNGYRVEVLLLWLVPARLSLDLLAWGCPHRPHQHPRARGPLRHHPHPG